MTPSEPSRRAPMRLVAAADAGGAATEMWATFMAAGEVFSLRVEDVQEVLRPQPLTPVPLAPAHIKGLLNLRGQIMTAIDLRTRLGMPPLEREEPGSLLVVKTQDRLFSIIVDEIGDVLALPRADWRPPPQTLKANHRPYVESICPVDGALVLGLRVLALSSDEDV